MGKFTEGERKYLSESRLGRIATVGKDGTPHVVPVGWRYNPGRESIDVGGRDFSGPRSSVTLGGAAARRS